MWQCKYVFKILFLHEIVLILLYFTMNVLYELLQVSLIWYTVVAYVYIYVFMFMCIYIELMTISVSLVDPWKNKEMIMVMTTVFTQIQDEFFPNS